MPRLAFLANPNSPSGTALGPDEVGALAARLDCPLVVDEAYVNFAATDCAGLVATHPNVIVLRTFSKGYSLAGLRLGYLIARPEIVAGLIKVKDSYNCDTLSLVGGAAALADQAHLAETRARILATRHRLTAALRALGYHVPESQANFVWCTGGPPRARRLPGAQGAADPRPPDALPRPPRRPADHRRHRRRDRPPPGEPW